MEAKDIKIIGVTVTYNSAERIPYVMPYYERMKIDKLVVYDNDSTDNTVELLSRYPFVEIRSYHTERYDEGQILKFKTDIQDEFKGQYDWCISTYFDEVFYSERDFREVLFDKMNEGKTYFLKTGLNIFSRHFPPTDNGKLVHENVGRGALWTSDDGIMRFFGNKIELFNMSKVHVTYNSGGCHQCQLDGELNPFEDEIGFFHLKFLDFDYICKSNDMYLERMEGTDDVVYFEFFENNMEDVYSLMEKRAISVDRYMKSSMNELLPQQIVFAVHEPDLWKQRKYIDTLKKHSDYGIIKQYALLFYGTTEDKNTDNWYYAREKNIMIMLHKETDDLRVAVDGFSYMFGNTLRPDPWVVEIDSPEAMSFSLFDNMEPRLSELAAIGVTKTEMVPLFKPHGPVFTRYSRLINGPDYSTLGCYMIVKNEEKVIRHCLDSIIDLCDEIVIVDTGCSDRTMDIVRSYGEKIKTFEFEWVNDFSAARNFAMSKVSTDYSFTTDADEVFTPELRETILRLKGECFNGKDSYDIWLMNKNGDNEPTLYIGGRQIVKSLPSNYWQYRVHEKLYFQRYNYETIPLEEGYIIHSHGSSNSVSNYNKYAEFYFQDLITNHVTHPCNGAHYYYYMFMTIKGLDIYAAKYWLSQVYNPEKIISYTEDQRPYLYSDGFVSTEELFAMQLMANCGESSFIEKMGEAMNEELPRYMLLKTVYDTKPNELTPQGWIDLAFYSYSFGNVRDFLDLTKESTRFVSKEDVSEQNQVYAEFVNDFIDSHPLIIDCIKGYGAIASNLYYFSRMFKHIYVISDDEKLKKTYQDSIFGLKFVENIEQCPKNAFIMDGNKQIDVKTALLEFERALRTEKTEILRKNGEF